ncbi:MAG: hypothetical protein A2032_02580 [Chloroflexi bacterium RBG_19FT_COMBO_49_13]|nr:MAG: hypothetical protein A2032_02580 [Chloroflexi bacterium RBG_19FT_COMBO_49_13]
MSRSTKFMIAILLGAVAGLFYGWVVNPVEYVDIAPESLRVDYKTDYVLMIGEAYQVDHDLGLAVRRLAVLGSSAPTDIVANALSYALQHEYASQDLSLLQLLGESLLTWNPNMEVPTP